MSGFRTIQDVSDLFKNSMTSSSHEDEDEQSRGDCDIRFNMQSQMFKHAESN